MKKDSALDRSFESLLLENDALCRQLARMQQRASELIQARSAEVEQLNTVIEYLSAQLHDREAMILFLRTKLQEFRKMTDVPVERHRAPPQAA